MRPGHERESNFDPSFMAIISAPMGKGDIAAQRRGAPVTRAAVSPAASDRGR
jgi:hypothetical protein